MTRSITEIDDPRLVKALGHPLRVSILTALAERTMSPSELADELEVPLPNLSYHFRQLVDLDLLELKSTRQRRGAIEHYYRTKPGIGIAERAWGDLPPQIQRGFAGQALKKIIQGAAEAYGSGDLPDEGVRSWEIDLDARGWLAVERAADRFEKEVAKALADSRGRGDGARPTKIALLAWQLADRTDGGPGRARVLDAIRALERPTLGAITRALYPKHRGQIGVKSAPGRDVQGVLDVLLNDGAIREAGSYRRGTLYEVVDGA